MATYFIGVDFGTIHTKACVRENSEEEAAPVIVNENASGAERYLWPSADAEWSEDSPKVILCREHDIAPERENRALNAAAAAVTHCIRRALLQIFDSKCEIIVQLGLPTREGITDELAQMRYELILNYAFDRINDSRLRQGKPLLDERLAALALLHRARFEFNNEPLMVIDGGGWTTHASLLRWVSWPEAGVSLHGSETVMHGVQDVVRQIARSLRLNERQGERVLHDVIAYAYRSCKEVEGLNLQLASSAAQSAEIAASCRREWGLDDREAIRRVQHVLDELKSYVGHRRLKEAWETAWRGGWEASPGQRYYQRYRLFLLGGASRIGRTQASGPHDPIARRMQEFQKSRTVPFTEIVYPELNPQMWTVFKPRPEPEAIPYLFVAGGYTIPLPDWPEQIRREVIPHAKPPERPHYHNPESEPG